MHALERGVFYLFSFIPASPGVVLPWLVTLVLVSSAFVGTRSLALIPGARQNALEWVYESLEAFLITVVGKERVRELLPILASLFLYILCASLMGLVPGLKSPTSIFSVCLGMALVVFVLTHYLGFRSQGVGYLKHFFGDPWWLGPLMLPIHLIGELARPVSLTLRLFGNIMGEDVVILVLTVHLFPLLVPLPMIALAIFGAFLQALVFTILSGIYLSGALAAHDHTTQEDTPHGRN